MRTFSKCREQGDIGQASYCLSKAITADPKDITLRTHRALLYVELGDYQKAAAAYEQVHQLCHENVDALKSAAKVCLLLCLFWARLDMNCCLLCCHQMSLATVVLPQLGLSYWNIVQEFFISDFDPINYFVVDFHCWI